MPCGPKPPPAEVRYACSAGFVPQDRQYSQLACGHMWKINNHGCAIAHHELRLAKTREEERAADAPAKTRARACPRSVLGETGDSSPIFHPVGCFWRHLLAPKGVEHATSEFPKREFPRFPIVHIFFVLLARPESTKIKYGENARVTVVSFDPRFSPCKIAGLQEQGA